jgi:PAS domain-containing protein
VNAVVTADLNEMEEYEIDGYMEIPVPYAVFKLIYNAAKDRVTETKYVFVNEKYCEMVGRTDGKILLGRGLPRSIRMRMTAGLTIVKRLLHRTKYCAAERLNH